MDAWLTYIGFIVFFVPLIIGIIRWKALSGGQMILVAFVGFVIPFSVVAEVVGQTTGNNLLLYHIYTFIEFFTLAWIFRRTLRRVPTGVFIGGSLVILAVGTWGLITAPFEVPVTLRTVESVMLAACALTFFYDALRYLEFRRIEQTFMFWISGAVLLYFAGNLLLDAFGNYVAEASDRVFFTVWSIHAVFNVILYLLYGVSLLWKDPIPPSSPSSLSAR